MYGWCPDYYPAITISQSQNGPSATPIIVVVRFQSAIDGRQRIWLALSDYTILGSFDSSGERSIQHLVGRSGKAITTSAFSCLTPQCTVKFAGPNFASDAQPRPNLYWRQYSPTGNTRLEPWYRFRRDPGKQRKWCWIRFVSRTVTFIVPGASSWRLLIFVGVCFRSPYGVITWMAWADTSMNLLLICDSEKTRQARTAHTGRTPSKNHNLHTGTRPREFWYFPCLQAPQVSWSIAFPDRPLTAANEEMYTLEIGPKGIGSGR